MRWMLVASWVVAVGGCRGAVAVADQQAPRARPTPVPIAEVLTDASGPDGEHAVGAVPIPGDLPSSATPIHEIDPTITFDELPRVGAGWHERGSLQHAGRMLIALHIASHERLELAVVGTELSEQGYPGTLETFALGPTDTDEAPRGGNAYPPRDANEYAEGGYAGPIRFAIRSRPRAGAPDAEQRQVVVYVVERSLLVAERLRSAPTWTPRLRIDVPRATEIVAINPGWH